jgi:hypothetical protein
MHDAADSPHPEPRQLTVSDRPRQQRLTRWVSPNFTTRSRSQKERYVNWSHLSLDDLNFLDTRKSVCTSYPPPSTDEGAPVRQRGPTSHRRGVWPRSPRIRLASSSSSLQHLGGSVELGQLVYPFSEGGALRAPPAPPPPPRTAPPPGAAARRTAPRAPPRRARQRGSRNTLPASTAARSTTPPRAR